MAKAPIDIRSLARSHAESAIKVLAGIMNDPAAPASARAQAATVLLNRGFGELKGAQRYVLAKREYYVYSIHKNGLVYIGKGCGNRFRQSASRLNGTGRIRAVFNNEQDALAFERRLIKRFRPLHNIVHNSQLAQ